MSKLWEASLEHPGRGENIFSEAAQLGLRQALAPHLNHVTALSSPTATLEPPKVANSTGDLPYETHHILYRIKDVLIIVSSHLEIFRYLERRSTLSDAFVVINIRQKNDFPDVNKILASKSLMDTLETRLMFYIISHELIVSLM